MTDPDPEPQDFGPDPAPEPAHDTPAQPGSPLANLRQRRDEIAAEQVLDLPVPRWSDPELVVRYRPGEHRRMRNALDKIEKAPARERAEVEVTMNTDLLIHACLGVFARIGGRPYVCTGPDEWTPIPTDDEGTPVYDDWDGFSPHLAATLGAATESARSVVSAMFLTDGDILATAGKLMQWSGYQEAEADEAILGE